MTPETLNAIERLSSAIGRLADVVEIKVTQDGHSAAPGLREVHKELEDLYHFLQLCHIEEAPVVRRYRD